MIVEYGGVSLDIPKPAIDLIETLIPGLTVAVLEAGGELPDDVAVHLKWHLAQTVAHYVRYSREPRRDFLIDVGACS